MGLSPEAEEETKEELVFMCSFISELAMSGLLMVSRLPRQVVRSLNTSVTAFKQIKHTETDNRIVVEGVMDTHKATDQKTVTGSAPKCTGGSHQCHPFCKSPIVKEVRHTDVLILNQFVDSKGEMYSKEDLGICTVRSDDVRGRKSVICNLSCIAETVDEIVQVGPDVSEGGADAREGVLLLRVQEDQVGQSELLLGREDY